ncbi:MAG: sugar ABC transporter permease [Oscillospiraceae bacterium]|jgi:multiple sugar transport system permease protein|nr:sugar ABC transporter permease [Oscillospiraceae bacterium]MDD3260647.1 sugar ABC transporter permease [Oscillospiraceae bacterium]
MKQTGKKQAPVHTTSLRSIRGQQRLVTVLFMIVPLFLLILFTYLPFAKMIQFSFFNMKYTGTRRFIGWQNYISVFTRSDIFPALKLSLFYMAGAVIQMALALFFATMLTGKLKGGAFFKGALFFPYLICGIAVGYIFKFFFTHGFVLDTLLTSVGFKLQNLPYWLKDTRINNIMLAGTSVWRYLGQNMIMFIGAMMSVDEDVYEAAMIDGANAWQKFWSITMPGIKTMVVLNLILSISGSLSAFEPPYVITNGTFGTGTYFVVMDRIAHVNLKVGLASAMAVVLMILIILVTVLQKVVSHLMLDEDETGHTYRERRAEKKRQAAQAAK